MAFLARQTRFLRRLTCIALCTCFVVGLSAYAFPPGGNGGGGNVLPTNPTVAYIELRKQGYNIFDIRLLDTTTGEDGLLVPEMGGPHTLKWSPDGSQIAYGNRETGGLHIVNIDGSGTVRTLLPDERVDGVDWSNGPTINGREMILFNSWEYGESHGIVRTARNARRSFPTTWRMRMSSAGLQVAAGSWHTGKTSLPYCASIPSALSITSSR